MRKLFAWSGFLALTAYGWLLATHAQGVASGADNSGYMNAARLFLAGRMRDELRVPEGFTAGTFRSWLFTPLGFQPAGNGQALVPVYPPGLPVQQAAWAWVLGSVEKGAVAMNVFCGLAFLWLSYRLARRLGLSREAAGLATLLLAANPVSLRFFTWNMSDGPAAAWVLASFYFALKSHKGARYAGLAGVAFAIALATRPTNGLLVPALLLALPRQWPAWAWFLGGSVPGIAALGWYNTLQFGAFYRTGYAHLQTEFKWRYFFPSIQHYGLWFGRFFSPLVLLPLLVHLRGVLFRRPSHLLLAAWWLPLFGFYAFYKYTNDAWWYLRFILPALPALVVALTLAGWELWRGTGKRGLKVSLSAFTLAALVSCGWWSYRLRVLPAAAGENIYREGVAWARQNLKQDTVLFVGQLSGAVYFYSSRPLVRADLISESELEKALTLVEQAGKEAYAILFDFEARVYPRVFPNLYHKVMEWRRLSLWRITRGDVPSPAPVGASRPAG